MFGVFMNLLPKQARSEYPMSSAVINIIFGFFPAASAPNNELQNPGRARAASPSPDVIRKSLRSIGYMLPN
jgi:hypothetical protein